VFDPGCRGAEQMNAVTTASGACGGVDSGGKREEVNFNAFKLRVTFKLKSHDYKHDRDYSHQLENVDHRS
jgi:hypothetical protein